MSTFTTNITVANENYSSLLITDNTVGNAGDVTYSITAATVSVYVRGSSTPTIINVLSYYLAASGLPVTYSIIPSQLNQLGTVFTDGSYQLIFNITRVHNSTDTQVGTQINYQLMIANALSCLQGKIGNLADMLGEKPDCGCTENEKEIDFLFTMYMQLQSAVFSNLCGQYLNAQSKVDSVNLYCVDNCGCNCNDIYT